MTYSYLLKYERLISTTNQPWHPYYTNIHPYMCVPHQKTTDKPVKGMMRCDPNARQMPKIS